LLATLSGGDFFGEQALVTREPRSATIKALSDVGLLRFSRDDLDEVIQQYPNIESELQIEAFQHRMQKRLSILKKLMPEGQQQ
jgi:voltage-gated potassium channel